MACRRQTAAGGDAQRTARTAGGHTPLAVLLRNVPRIEDHEGGREWEQHYAQLDWLLRGRHADLAPAFSWYGLQWDPRLVWGEWPAAWYATHF